MALTQQTNRRILRLTTVLLVLGSCFLLWRAFCAPAVPGLATSSIEVAVPRDVVDTIATRGPSDFASLLDRSLRAPLYDPPPKSIEPETLVEEELEPYDEEELPELLEPNAEIGLRLVGSMIEVGRSVAILINGQGNVVLGKEGESIETPAGAIQIQKVEVEQVTIVHDNDSLTLRMAR